MAVLTAHLIPWSDQRLADAKQAVEDLLESENPGLVALFELVESYADSLVAELMNETPSDEGAKYAAKLAEIRALRSLPDLIEGVRRSGTEAEARLRETDD